MEEKPDNSASLRAALAPVLGECATPVVTTSHVAAATRATMYNNYPDSASGNISRRQGPMEMET